MPEQLIYALLGAWALIMILSTVAWALLIEDESDMGYLFILYSVSLVLFTVAVVNA